MAKRKQINEETFNKVRNLLGYGLKQQQVAGIIGCSAVTVNRINKTEAKDYAAWRAEVRARNQAEYRKSLESQADTEKAAPEQTPDEESTHDIEIPHITIPSNETADAIRELTSVMRELVEAWEGNQAKKRRIF